MGTLGGYRPSKTAEEIRKELEDKKKRKENWEKQQQKKKDEENQLPPDFFLPDNDANDSDD